MTGYPPLLEKIGQKIETSYGRKLEASQEVLVTAGATQGIYTAIQALVRTGQEVIILDPSYDCYEPAVILAGGKPIRIDLNNYFSPNWQVI